MVAAMVGKAEEKVEVEGSEEGMPPRACTSCPTCRRCPRQPRTPLHMRGHSPAGATAGAATVEVATAAAAVPRRR